MATGSRGCAPDGKLCVLYCRARLVDDASFIHPTRPHSSGERMLTPYQLVGMVLEMSRLAMTAFQHESRTRLLDATLNVVRAKGYTAARIEDVCAEAGLTKGSFFHHFKSKEDLALAAAAHWDAHATELFATAPYHELPDPLERLIAYIDFRKEILTGDLPEFTCFAGTIIQEAYRTHPEISAACERGIATHAKTLVADIRAAMRKYDVCGNWSAESLALHIQAVIQGGFILAKAKGSAAVAVQCLDHLRLYIEQIFTRTRSAKEKGEIKAAPRLKRARRGIPGSSI
jgi:TetR/AcrR family transcriptional repressor of nem operon